METDCDLSFMNGRGGSFCILEILKKISALLRLYGFSIR